MLKLTALLVVLLTASPVTAQPQTSKDLTGTTCPGAGCLDVTVDSFAATGVQISNTFVGTITFRHTIESTAAPTYIDLPMTPSGGGATVTTTTTPGIWTAATTAKKIRIVFTAYTSGTATISTISTTASRVASVAANGSGDGVPGGASTTLQYNNAGAFGGAAPWKFTGNNAITSTATGTWFRNTPTETSDGGFEFVIGVASNDVPPGDTRPDHVAAIGWNAGGDATPILANGTAVGASSLVFESYCSYGTGCLGGGGGQSETYFNMNDGKGSAVRPLGFFQAKAQGASHFLSAIARADTWGFFDATQTNLIFSIGAAHDAQNASVVLNGVMVATSPDGGHGNWLFQDGQSLIRSDVVGVAVAPNSSVVIGGGSDGAATFNVNHIGLLTGAFEDLAGKHRLNIGAGSDTNYPSLGSSGTDDIILKPLGSSANIQMSIESKGTSGVYLNPTGPLRINGINGVTVSGSTCTITQITKGIITGASCTP